MSGGLARATQGQAGRLAARAAISIALALSPARVLAQAAAPPNPHAAQPERPTVATHAYTVAPGWTELELGFQRQQEGVLSNRLALPFLLKIGLGSHVQLDLAPAWDRNVESGRIEEGITDLVVGVKWRLADTAPLLGAFGIQTTVSFPTGNANAGLGTGSAGLTLLLISSHQAGPVSVDANVGYTRLGGDGTHAPNNSTLWTVSAGFPVAGSMGWTAEIFGYPGTSGPSGAPPVVACLAGPTFAVRPYLVLDAGAIFDIAGFGGTAVYGGATWNIGRLWGASRQSTRGPLQASGPITGANRGR